MFPAISPCLFSNRFLFVNTFRKNLFRQKAQYINCKYDKKWGLIFETQSLVFWEKIWAISLAFLISNDDDDYDYN